MSYQMSILQMLDCLGVELGGIKPAEKTIYHLTLDSRQVKAGSAFIALPGTDVDGRQFITAAIAAGADLILAEKQDIKQAVQLDQHCCIVHIRDLRRRLGDLVAQFYGHPSRDLQVFGVTGTNGKSTSCYLLAQAFEQLGLKAAVLGTLGYGAIGDLQTANHTTPDVISLHRWLAEFRDAGYTQVCMEVSSHALSQLRVAGVEFYCTIFTNLTHDHLDYHGDMQSYAQAKLSLFTDWHSQLTVTNAENELGQQIASQANTDFVVRYGDGGDVQIEDIVLSNTGIELSIFADNVDFQLQTGLVGTINLPNILMLCATLLALSVDVEDIQRISAKLKPAPGRMELYACSGHAQVVVDYAHTPDALEKALLSVKNHCQGKLWCVFGCGGERDKDKRPLMGEIASRLADQVIITNDNPRHEVPEQIVEQIVAGTLSAPQIVLSRGEAINTAFAEASEQDWILIAGKGHETTQQIGNQYMAFSDRQWVKQMMENAT